METTKMSKVFLFLGGLLLAAQSFAGSDIVKSTRSFKYMIYGDVRQKVISFSDENGYEIFCGGAISYTADLIVHSGLIKDANRMDLTTGKTVAERKKLSRQECSRLQVELASATEEHPVSISVQDDGSFLINSK